MQLRMRNIRGKVAGTIKVRDDVFDVPMNPPVVHQVMVGQLANLRLGTVSVKTRAQVSGGGRKPRAQKHTGGARQGSIRAPHYRGGGVTFGPRPRKFGHHTPKRMKRLSLLATLSDKVRQKELVVVKTLNLERSMTKEMVEVLEALDAGPSVLLVADGADPSVLRSARNIPRLKMIPAALLNTLDLLKYRKVVMTLEAVRKAEELWGGTENRRRKQAAPAVVEG